MVFTVPQNNGQPTSSRICNALGADSVVQKQCRGTRCRSSLDSKRRNQVPLSADDEEFNESDSNGKFRFRFPFQMRSIISVCSVRLLAC